ncbi:hypothetical protein C0J52_06128 [Blattella germanica]|nr:hypothetical protein C0J52_06128 [Blattella germanica]
MLSVKRFVKMFLTDGSASDKAQTQEGSVTKDPESSEKCGMPPKKFEQRGKTKYLRAMIGVKFWIYLLEEKYWKVGGGSQPVSQLRDQCVLGPAICISKAMGYNQPLRNCASEDRRLFPEFPPSPQQQHQSLRNENDLNCIHEERTWVDYFIPMHFDSALLMASCHPVSSDGPCALLAAPQRIVVQETLLQFLYWSGAGALSAAESVYVEKAVADGSVAIFMRFRNVIILSFTCYYIAQNVSRRSFALVIGVVPRLHLRRCSEQSPAKFGATSIGFWKYPVEYAPMSVMASVRTTTARVVLHPVQLFLLRDARVLVRGVEHEKPPRHTPDEGEYPADIEDPCPAPRFQDHPTQGHSNHRAQ